MALVRSNVSRVKVADAMRGSRIGIPKLHKFRVGTGGKDTQGSLKAPDGSLGGLFSEVKIIDISEIVKVTDYEYLYRLAINTDVHADLVGQDINEIALYDEEGDWWIMETIEGYGAFQTGHLYEFEMRVVSN